MIGIFGGTFDPVHYGHLRPVQDVMAELGLNKVLFIPNNVPPHRDQPQLTTAQRIELLQLALLDFPGFEIDLREVQRSGKSFMVDTLADLQREYPEETLCLIIGMDAFIGITSWHEWQQLFDYCHLVVTARPGYQMGSGLDRSLLERMVDDAGSLRQSRTGKILVKSATLLDISASEIRERIETGDDAEDLMPLAVYTKYREIMSLHAS